MKGYETLRGPDKLNHLLKWQETQIEPFYFKIPIQPILYSTFTIVS